MNCNPDIKRVECWMCQRNPYVQRVPLTVAGGNPSPGHPVPLKIDRDECEVIAAWVASPTSPDSLIRR